MKKKGLIIGCCILIFVIGIAGIPTLINAAVGNSQIEMILSQYQNNNPTYIAAQKKSEMTIHDTYGIEMREQENTISSNNVRIGNCTETYRSQLEIGGIEAARETAEELDQYMLDNISRKQKIAYYQIQQSLNHIKGGNEHNSNQKNLIFQQYCNGLMLSVLDAKKAYYVAIETEYQAELNIEEARKKEGYAREIDCKAVQAKLETLRAEKSAVQNEFSHIKQKVERYSGISIDTIQYGQIEETVNLQQNNVLQGFREVGIYEQYNHLLTEAYKNYSRELTVLLNQMNERTLIQLTPEIEPTENHIQYEQELKEYLEEEITNYEMEVQICDLQYRQYEMDLGLYVMNLCDAAMDYASQYKATQAELDVLNQQRTIQNALYEEGMGRHYEVLQIETNIKKVEYQKQEICYQYMRIIFIIENYLENQDI